MNKYLTTRLHTSAACIAGCYLLGVAVYYLPNPTDWGIKGNGWLFMLVLLAKGVTFLSAVTFGVLAVFAWIAPDSAFEEADHE